MHDNVKRNGRPCIKGGRFLFVLDVEPDQPKAIQSNPSRTNPIQSALMRSACREDVPLSVIDVLQEPQYSRGRERASKRHE